MDTKQEFTKAKEVVEELLKEDERCREDDLWLVLRAWQEKQHIKVYVPYEKLREMLKPETITRCRRKIQNDEGKYLPKNEEVLLRRGYRQNEVREWVRREDER